MNRYCESLMGSFSQTSNESWFPRHDGINDQQRVCLRSGFPVIHTQARNCSLATGEPLLWISVSHLTDGFPPGCDALCSPSFYFSTKLSLNVALLFCPFLCINERISSQIWIWITVQWWSQRESTSWWFLQETKICHWSCYCLQQISACLVSPSAVRRAAKSWWHGKYTDLWISPGWE